MLSDTTDPLEVGAADDFLFYLREGGEQMRAGRLAEARTAFERALDLNPESARVQNMLGLVYFKLGLLEAAKSIYDRLVAEYPDEAPLLVNLGLVLLRQGRLAEAETALSGAIELAPEHARAHCYLGMVFYRRGDLLRARHHFVLGDSPEFAEKVRKKLESGAGDGERHSLLGAIAAEGLDLLASDARALSLVEPAGEERVARDEDAWEARSAHLAPPGDDLEIESLAGLGRSAPPEPPPLRLPTGARPLSIEDRGSLPPPVVDDEIAYGAPEGRVALRPVAAELTADESPAGFLVGADAAPEVVLVLDGSAQVRSSVLIAAQGGLRLLEATLESRSNPFVRLEGAGRAILRLPNHPALLTDFERVTVRASALAGFEGELVWARGEAVGSAVLELRGRGSVLLNSPRRATILEIAPGAAVACRRDAFLAWTRGVRGEPIALDGVGEGFVRFGGRGFLVLAGADAVATGSE